MFENKRRLGKKEKWLLLTRFSNKKLDRWRPATQSALLTRLIRLAQETTVSPAWNITRPETLTTPLHPAFSDSTSKELSILNKAWGANRHQMVKIRLKYRDALLASTRQTRESALPRSLCMTPLGPMAFSVPRPVWSSLQDSRRTKRTL